jgi:hypothetical protein
MKIKSEQDLDEMIETVEPDFITIRRKIQKAVDSSPETITFEEAKQQVEKFNRGSLDT